MASQTITLMSYSALGTPTLRLFADGSDTQVSGSPFTLVEATNRKGLYSVTFTGTLDGIHSAHLYSGSTFVGAGWVTMENASGTYHVRTEYDASATPTDVSAILSEDVPAAYAQGSVGWALGRIGLGKITVNSPVLPDGSVSIIQRGSYKTRFGNALDWTDTDADLSWPTLTGAEIRLQVGDGLLDIVGEVVTGTGSPKRVRAQLSSTTTDIAPGVYPMVLKAFFTGTGTDDDEYPLAVGSFTVLDGEAD